MTPQFQMPQVVGAGQDVSGILAQSAAQQQATLNLISGIIAGQVESRRAEAEAKAKDAAISKVQEILGSKDARRMETYRLIDSTPYAPLWMEAVAEAGGTAGPDAYQAVQERLVAQFTSEQGGNWSPEQAQSFAADLVRPRQRTVWSGDAIATAYGLYSKASGSPSEAKSYIEFLTGGGSVGSDDFTDDVQREARETWQTYAGRVPATLEQERASRLLEAKDRLALEGGAKDQEAAQRTAALSEFMGKVERGEGVVRGTEMPFTSAPAWPIRGSREEQVAAWMAKGLSREAAEDAVLTSGTGQPLAWLNPEMRAQAEALGVDERFLRGISMTREAAMERVGSDALEFFRASIAGPARTEVNVGPDQDRQDLAAAAGSLLRGVDLSTVPPLSGDLFSGLNLPVRANIPISGVRPVMMNGRLELDVAPSVRADEGRATYLEGFLNDPAHPDRIDEALGHLLDPASSKSPTQARKEGQEARLLLEGLLLQVGPVGPPAVPSPDEIPASQVEGGPKPWYLRSPGG